MNPLLILLLCCSSVYGQTNEVKPTSQAVFYTTTNSFRIVDFPQLERSMVVTLVGIPEGHFYFPPRCYFHYTNFVIHTKYAPQIRQSNDWWLIELKEER